MLPDANEHASSFKTTYPVANVLCGIAFVFALMLDAAAACASELNDDPTTDKCAMGMCERGEPEKQNLVIKRAPDAYRARLALLVLLFGLVSHSVIAGLVSGT